MLWSDRSKQDWIQQYAASHQHPLNQLTHMLGIPMIVLSLLGAVSAFFYPALLYPSIVLFILGWVLQFIGHWIEGKPPEFLSDWRFLFIGFRWWLSKVIGK